MRVIIVTTALLLAGCTSYTWERPGLDPATAERAREIDTAECTVAAMQTVPAPNNQLLAAPARPSEYLINGTTTSYGPNGEVNTGYYSGVATPSGGGDRSAEGIAEAQFLTDSNNAAHARASLANACMLRRGWVKVKSGQEAMAAPAASQVPIASAALVQASAPVARRVYSDAAVPPATPPAQAAQRYNEWSKTQGDN